MQESIPQRGVSERPLNPAGALATSIALVVIAALGIRYGAVQLAQLHSLIPIFATLAASAELVTAFLLLSQFYVAGKISYALLAAGYGFTGLLNVPYLFEFPGVFPLPTSNATLQISVWLWMISHCIFAITLIAIAISTRP